MAMNAFLILLVMGVPRGGLKGRDIVQNVDVIEYNHYYNEDGGHVYDQVIFYEWSPDYGRLHVVYWRLVKKPGGVTPRKDPCRKDYYCRWYDTEYKRYRVVRSKIMQETWTKTDPERENKRLMEERYRAGLLKPEKTKSVLEKQK